MNERRHDLDWLRIIAFGLLILYHIGMFYVTWGWHVKSSHSGPAIEPLMLLVNPWRLTLLFLVSGVATRFLADKLALGRFTASRMTRLGPPLLLAFFVIVPPQSYYEVVEALQEMSGPIGPPQSLWLQNFYLKYMTGSGHWCDYDGCLYTPTYNHMWFVAYLIIYTLVLTLLIPLLRRLPSSAAKLIQGSGLILLPWAYLFITRVTLQPIFGGTHAFWNDWYLHSVYLATFLFGFAVAKHQPFFESCTRLRWIALTIALTAWAVMIANSYIFHNNPTNFHMWIHLAFRGMHELQAWTAIIAAIGFAHYYLRDVDTPLKRTLSQAIFPFYLIHQTIIVVTGHYLDDLALPISVEATLLIAATALGCWLFFDLGRRVPLLRPWIGLSR